MYLTSANQPSFSSRARSAAAGGSSGTAQPTSTGLIVMQPLSRVLLVVGDALMEQDRLARLGLPSKDHEAPATLIVRKNQKALKALQALLRQAFGPKDVLSVPVRPAGQEDVTHDPRFPQDAEHAWT